MINLALYQPDIPQNTGAAIRLAACLGLKLDIIEPCGFPWDDAKIRRAAMDYIDHIEIHRHTSWNMFRKIYTGRRVILMTTRAAQSYLDFTYEKGDILLAGRESAGVPDEVHAACDGRILIPMSGGVRSLNVINACAMITGEALRQIAYIKETL